MEPMILDAITKENPQRRKVVEWNVVSGNVVWWWWCNQDLEASRLYLHVCTSGSGINRPAVTNPPCLHVPTHLLLVTRTNRCPVKT